MNMSCIILSARPHEPRGVLAHEDPVTVVTVTRALETELQEKEGCAN